MFRMEVRMFYQYSSHLYPRVTPTYSTKEAMRSKDDQEGGFLPLGADIGITRTFTLPRTSSFHLIIVGTH